MRFVNSVYVEEKKYPLAYLSMPVVGGCTENDSSGKLSERIRENFKYFIMDDEIGMRYGKSALRKSILQAVTDAPVPALKKYAIMSA